MDVLQLVLAADIQRPFWNLLLVSLDSSYMYNIYE